MCGSARAAFSAVEGPGRIHPVPVHIHIIYSKLARHQAAYCRFIPMVDAGPGIPDERVQIALVIQGEAQDMLVLF